MRFQWIARSPAERLYRRNLELFPTHKFPFGWPIFFLITASLFTIIQFFPRLPWESEFPRPMTALAFLIVCVFLLKIFLSLFGLRLSTLGLSRQRLLREIAYGMGVYIIVALYAVASSVMRGIPPQPDWPSILVHGSFEQRLEITAWLSKLLVTACAVGVSEEMIYRGLITTFLLTRWNTAEGALWASALVFAFAHLEFEPSVFIGRVVMGYIFGLLYIWRKNLTAAISMHTLHNFCVWAGLLGGR